VRDLRAGRDRIGRINVCNRDGTGRIGEDDGRARNRDGQQKNDKRRAAQQ
jgi:hypothetical protein